MSAPSTSRPDVLLRSCEPEPAIAVCYSWIGDRYQHRISAWIEGRERVVATSVEGDKVDSPYEAPTFQELSIESIGGAEVACLVGMSGKVYWSASVEGILGSRGFLFDLSCKGSANTKSSCAYTVSLPMTLAQSGNVVIPLDSKWCCFLTGDRIDGEAGLIRIELDRLTITGPPPGAHRSASLRNKYQWRLLTQDEISGMDAESSPQSAITAN